MHWAKVDSIFRQICSRLGEKIQSFIVFGSVARGETRHDSNIDLMILFASRVEGNDIAELQTIVRCHSKEEGPSLSINVAVTDDFLCHLCAGDQFSKSVALEGYCLLQSAIFTAARNLVHGGTMLSDKAAIEQRLREHNGRSDLNSYHHFNGGCSEG